MRRYPFSPALPPAPPPRRARKSRAPVASEESVHRAVVSALCVGAPRDVVWWHIPNGGSRSRSEAGRFRAMGVKPGVPDLQFIRGGRVYFLELKSTQGRESEAQGAMRARLLLAGAVCHVAHGLDAALAWLKKEGLLSCR